MDSLRSNLGAVDIDRDSDDAYSSRYDTQEESHGTEAPPPAIGTDERRMQVRAYNFWASQLDDRNFPLVSDLDPAAIDDFGANSVLLDFSQGSEDPRIAFLGETLAGECDAAGLTIDRLADVPSRSLLSRITDHYMQILANQAPIGFEAEFVNQRGVSVLYRGILLPYSSDDDTIDFIYGVINWKEMADQQSADELLLEIDQVLEGERSPLARRGAEIIELTDWADGPGADTDAVSANDDWDDVDARPGFDLAEPEAVAMSDAPVENRALADWLASAREMAQAANDREERTRNALYEAIGRAWDFALAAADAPDEFAELLADAGLTMQDRAPMTPVVKLVFGVDYDKTRLTEYAAALSHAQRLGLGRGELAGHLRDADGGLKGVVAYERRFRREEAGKPPQEIRTEPRKAIARKLREMAPQGFNAVPRNGHEFALVMIRRTESGEVVMLGEVPGNASLVEKAARELLG